MMRALTYKLSKAVLLIGFILFSAGCASFGQSLKALVSGKQEQAPLQKAKPMSFSENSFYQGAPRRQYKRVTKKSLEDESRLDSRSGSLWVMEGQGAYLFSQNIVRMIGDALAVTIDGEPKEQLEAKAKVISDLLEKIEQRKTSQERSLASEGENKAEKGKSDKKQATATTKKVNPVKDYLPVKTVPTRITERMVDGNYRVKGSQPFMLGKYQYKVIVTGIIRSEDFNEEGVSATKLLDPNFDIVSVRRSTAKL